MLESSGALVIWVSQVTKWQIIIIIIIIMLSRLLFACGASTQFDLQGKPCIGRVKTPVA